MSLTLSSADLQRLEQAMTALLSPLSLGSVDAWRAAAVAAVVPVASADRSVFLLPCPGEELIYRGPEEEDAIQAYLDYFGQLDIGLRQRRRERGLQAFHVYDVHTPEEWHASELHNDFGLAYRFIDPCVLSTDVTQDGPPAALLLYRGSEQSPSVTRDDMAMLRLLVPAFKAGVHIAIRLAHSRARLAALIDGLTAGVAVYDVEGRMVHRNPALADLLAGDPEAARITAEIDRVALGTLALEERRARQRRRFDAVTALSTPTSRRIRTGRSVFDLRGSFAPPDLVEPRAAVLVLVERASSRPLLDRELCARYGLTPREVTVARRLALGETDRSIAEALGVSHHTARRHAERVLRKLGVHTRGAVSQRLLHGEDDS